ncbi:MAG: hypothetical protein LBG17_06560 [Bacteroidales bacterium]|nr:hypothetical protein [Bacteroidales bacterium]
MAIIICTVIAAVFAILLYVKTKNLEIPGRWKFLLTGFRFLSVFILSFILFSPLLKMKVKRIDKPQVFIALDCSKSMRANDTAKILSDVNKFAENLEKNFDVKKLSFGKNVMQNADGADEYKVEFNENATDFSALFDRISILKNDELQSAVVLLTDGNFNYGASPLYSYADVSVPLYAVAFGDTVIYPDIAIARVYNNKYAYPNNFFPLEVLVETRGVNEIGNVTVSVFHNGKTVEEKPLGSDMSVQFDIKADKAGLQAYTVKVGSIKGEKNITNNSKTFYIDVLERKQKVLILSSAPHPDITAIRQALGAGDMFETDVYIGREIPQNISEYNLLFLHGLPSTTYPVRGLQSVLNEKSLFVIINEATDLNALGALNTGFNITLKSNSFSEATASKNSTFGLFSLSEEDDELLQQFPPLSVPFGTYKISPSGEALLYQKIMNITSENPLLWFSVNGGRGIGVFAGSGIYRWRLNNYLLKQNTKIFDDLMIRAVQLLANRESKDPLIIRHPKYFYEQTPVIFDAELYDALFEPLENKKISISIVDSSRKEYPYDFSPQGKFYQLNAGYLPAGNYHYKASSEIGNKKVEKSGIFSIVPLQLEDATLPANTAFLRDITKRYAGFTVTSGLWYKQLQSALENRADLKPQIRYVEKHYSLVERWWLWLILVLLLGSEWFVRKYYGHI